MKKLKKTFPKNYQQLILNEDWEMLKTELEKCEPQVPNRKPFSILFASALDKNTNVRKYLSADMLKWAIKNHGCDPNLTAFKGDSYPLHHYILANKFEDKLDCIIALLELGANPNVVNNVTNPLNAAIRDLNYSLVEVLLKFGANPNFDYDATLNRHSYPALDFLLNFLVKNTSSDLQAYLKDHPIVFNPDIQENFFKILLALIKYKADKNRDTTKKILQQIFEQFKESYDNQYFSTNDEKAAREFELKLYEIMEFKPY